MAAERDRRPVAPLALATVLVAVAAVLPASAQSTQTPGRLAPASPLKPPGPAPVFRLLSTGPEADGRRLVVTIPDGWALYAPDTGALGLPLAARWVFEHGPPRDAESRDRLRGERTSEAPLKGPPARIEASVAGPVRVYRGAVTVHVEGGDAGSVAELDVTWALCREELCVPGRTRVPLRPRTDSGAHEQDVEVGGG